VALGLAALIGGCATVPADRGLSDVSALTVARGGPSLQPGDDGDAQTLATIDNLLGQQLSVQDALGIALIHNPRIRAEYSRLGFASADVLEAGRLSNPTFSVSVLLSNAAGAADQVGFGLAQSFTNLLLFPSRSRFAKGELERVKAQVGAAVMALTRDVDSAFFTLVSAQQSAAMRNTVAKAAAASADLAQRFFDAGNITDLALSVEKAAAAQAELSARSAEARVVQARADLNKLMGLPASETRWSVDDRLPLPVAQEDELSALQSLAQRQRLDLAAAKQKVSLLSDAYNVTKTFRFLGNAEIGVMTERETDRSRITGPTFSWQLPIFNQNQGGVLRARSALELAQTDLKNLEIETSNGVALAHAKVEIARRSVELFRQKLIPLRERVVRRTQERVTYMLVGVFDLIRAKQDEYEAYQSYLEAVRDYWLARTELALAVGAPLPSSAQASEETVQPELPVPAPEHGGMGAMQGMSGMKGKEDMKGMDMKDQPGKGSMKGKESMDMKTKAGMDGMKNKEGMKGMDMKDQPGRGSMKGKESMDHGAPPKVDPAAVKAACEQIKDADMSDPLMQALALKCREQQQPGGEHH
jgi:cobalt-zinc-cadmium efflux system outer membrane protein